jgi:hypothetical protein
VLVAPGPGGGDGSRPRRGHRPELVAPGPASRGRGAVGLGVPRRPAPPAPPGLRLLYSFLVSAQRIRAELPQAAISRFEGALRGALKDSSGLRPFAYEVGIAAHLMQKNWDVEFADLCGTARFDILARQDNIEIEVECKTTSGDTGRKIHRQEVYRLANLILPTTQQLADTAGCHLVRVIIPNRLAPMDRKLAEIASIVASAGSEKCAASW